MSVRRVAACALLAGLLAVPASMAGVLTPPGAPGPTMKTLDEVEPRIPLGPLTTPGDADSVYRITQPGSYYLTGEVLGQAGSYGVQIEASDVTLDLMGFTVRGVSGARSGLIVSGGAQTGVTIINGVFRDWPEYGASVGAETSIVRNAQFIANGFDGLSIRSGVVESCTARENAFSGFRAQQATTFRNCAAEDNLGDGINSGINSSVINCVALLNGDDGIYGGSASTIIGCSAQQNDGDGFEVAFGSTITGCGARANGERGIRAADSLVERCVTDVNALDGVLVASDSVVRDCLSSGNGTDPAGGAGIRVTGSDNRLEGNTVLDNDIGIDIDSAGNLVARNTAAGNPTPYDIIVNNKVGPVVVAPNSGAILGAAGGAGLGSTYPCANFSY
ncbi:MAG: hypothetical protein ACF8QF_12150 [Phycisphaerales bacterium]